MSTTTTSQTGPYTFNSSRASLGNFFSSAGRPTALYSRCTLLRIHPFLRQQVFSHVLTCTTRTKRARARFCTCSPHSLRVFWIERRSERVVFQPPVLCPFVVHAVVPKLFRAVWFFVRRVCVRCVMQSHSRLVFRWPNTDVGEKRLHDWRL